MNSRHGLDEKCITVGFCTATHKNGKSADGEIVFYTFLCPACDNTHVIISCTTSPYMQFHAQLPAKASERLGHMLINPQPAQET